jgi:hypothetical protein
MQDLQEGKHEVKESDGKISSIKEPSQPRALFQMCLYKVSGCPHTQRTEIKL